MEIRNVTQFSNFITTNGIINLDSIFHQIVMCIDKYSSACNCHNANEKLQMYNNCNKLYLDAIRHIVPILKSSILSKVSGRRIMFYIDNGTLISIVE